MKKKASSHETAAPETPPTPSAPLVFCAYTRLVDVAELKPNPRNPKRHPRRQLEVYAKILAGGWRRPIVVSNRSGLIVKGHGAYEAARDVLKADIVPVDYQEYTSDEAELADLLADNKLAELAENDENALAELLGELTGKIDLELAGILASIEEQTPAASLKVLDVPPAPEMTWVLIGIPTVRFGDINAAVETDCPRAAGPRRNHVPERPGGGTHRCRPKRIITIWRASSRSAGTS